MLIGVPKEIKNHEYRVALTPNGAKQLTDLGHEVLIEKNAGAAIDFNDIDYQNCGAKIIDNAQELYAKSEMILKVKEPQPNECQLIKENQIIFSYLHLAAEEKLTQLLIKSKAIAIAFETVTDDQNRLPLLAPMSEVAGKISTQAGANFLQKANGGRGILLGGATGANAANVVVIGGGIAGSNAALIACGMGANVIILEKNLEYGKILQKQLPNAQIIESTKQNIEKYVIQADLVIGAVLVAGAAAPKLISKELLKKMKKHSVIIDIAIDQGGCFETSKPTTHENPTFIENNVIHYCVTNMPGATPRTSTLALQNATLPYVVEIANKGVKQALNENHHLLNGLNVINGKITCKPVAEFFNLEYFDPQAILSTVVDGNN